MFEIEYQKMEKSKECNNEIKCGRGDIRAYLGQLTNDEFILLIPLKETGSEDKEAENGKI